MTAEPLHILAQRIPGNYNKEYRSGPETIASPSEFQNYLEVLAVANVLREIDPSASILGTCRNSFDAGHKALSVHHRHRLET